MWRRTDRALRAFVERWALPQHCIFCGEPATQAICSACRGDLPGRAALRCPVCANQSPSAQICGQCLVHEPGFSHVAAAVSYAFPVDAAIQRLKYGADLALVEPLADLLAQRVADEPRPDLVIPMPLALERLRERGFNQALEIARAVSARLDLVLSPGRLSSRSRYPSADDATVESAAPEYSRRLRVRTASRWG